MKVWPSYTKRTRRENGSASVMKQHICRETVWTIYDLRNKVLTNVWHMNKTGVPPSVHGKNDRKPAHAPKFVEIKNAKYIYINYANEFGILQSAPVRGSDGILPIYLQYQHRKLAIHEKYFDFCQESNIRVLEVVSFEDIWMKCVPHTHTYGSVVIKMTYARNASPRENNRCQTASRKISSSYQSKK